MGTKVFSSAVNYSAITPNDSTVVSFKALYIGTGGDVTVAPSAAGTPVTFVGVASGTFFPVEVKNGRLMSTGTGATNIVSLGW